MSDNALLETKLVGDIFGDFFIPSYQRGYRWGNEQIDMLLNDIWENGEQNYCLQPIVVKNLGANRFELIDGQQRLTTIYLIMKYMHELMPTIIKNKFALQYETRDRSGQFLLDLDESLSKENIDFYHIYNAYKRIEAWFNDQQKGDIGLKAMNMYRYFGEKVKVIWYEVTDDVNSTDLFTRLNIGKIPLTNAELVKALFLSKDLNNISDEKQIEIVTSWDIIEQELHNDEFWSFVTNESSLKYATRIELIFNMIANKTLYEKEKFFTFYYFNKRMKTESKTEIWKEILEYYLILKEWFEKRNIYHKVGYLITVGYGLQTLIGESNNLSKSKFEASLDAKITDSLDLTSESLLDLNYSNKYHKPKIENLLLLFNVETTRLLKNTSEKYSFQSHKRRGWSLEHIHAQNSVGLNKKEDQQEWLNLHKKSLQNLLLLRNNNSEIQVLIERIDANYENINKVNFDILFADVFQKLSESEDRSYIDSISNMALLSMEDNAALNNATFDVKRNKVIEMDKNGDYIPICTRRVFLKYYTESQAQQLHFWGDQDRIAYIGAMIGVNGILNKYIQPLKMIDQL